MCRWLAYSGSPILMKEVLYGGTNSLVDQSLHSRLGAEPTNGDGFGVGWYGAPDTPGMFHSTEPAWNDQNLRELAGHISSPLFFTHIRAAIGSAVQQTNCHPFRHDRWLFMHNGYINEFATIKRDLILAVDPSLYPEIKGQADTEVLFFLALTFGLRGRPPGRRRASDRARRSRRRPPRRSAPVPGHGRDDRRREHLGVSVLQREKLAVALLHDRRAHAAQALSRPGRLPTILRRRAADRLRAPRRRRWRLERGARVHLGRGRRQTARKSNRSDPKHRRHRYQSPERGPHDSHNHRAF